MISRVFAAVFLTIALYASKPPVLLFDEPSSSLDVDATAKLEEVIKGLAKERTIILVTHDREQIERLSRGVVEL